MPNKFVHTCYGRKHYYSDKNDKWPRKRCGVDDHWSDCEIWKHIESIEKE